MNPKILKRTAFFGIPLLLINLVSAYNPFDNFNSWNLRPENLLQNEWVVFGGIFILTFALVYMALFRVFLTRARGQGGILAQLFPPRHYEGNQGPVMVISLVIALFTAAAISQRTYFYGYVGEAIGSWVIFGVAIVLTALAIYGSFKLPRMGKFLGFIVLFIVWIIIRSTDPYSILPYNISYELINAYYFLGSYVALGIIIVIGVAILLWNMRPGATPQTPQNN